MEQLKVEPAKRLMSLDVLRGLTIAGMLLVNNPGNWGHIYWPLAHAEWNGWTFTDLVFPFFLFMVGVAMMFSFPKRMERGESRRTLFAHVIRRWFVLLMLGFWGATFMLLPGGESWAESVPQTVVNEAGAEETFVGPLEITNTMIIGGTALRIGFAFAFLALVVLITGTERPRLWLTALGIGGATAAVGGVLAGPYDPAWTRLVEARWPGVLVRIGWCYLFASAIYFLTPSPKAIIAWIVTLLAIYWIWMLCIPIPGFGLADLSMGFPTLDTPRDQLFSNWCFFIDHHVLGTHVWGARELWVTEAVNGEEIRTLIWSFDPEGILSTMSAVCSVLLGVLTGLWLRRRDRSDVEKTNGLFVAACWLCLIGLVMSIWFPINKRIWTSSYTVFMGGMALLCLAMCYHVIDVKGYRRWAAPFQWYGMNAITAFVFSGMMAGMLGRLKVSTLNDEGVERLISLKSLIFNGLSQIAEPKNASLIFAVGFVILWAGIMGVMYRRRIFLKI